VGGTEESYLESLENLARFLAERGMPLESGAISGEHIEEWLVAMRAPAPSRRP
jgi:hypothetical protein